MKFAVVAPLYGDDPLAGHLLKESCRINKIPFLPYGRGVNWPGFREGKIVGLLEHLLEVDAEIVLATDGLDAFVTPSISDVVGKFYKFFGRAKIVIAGEKNCYPDPQLRDAYPHDPPTLYRYVNAGGFMGRKEYLLDALREMALWNLEDDQACWTRLFLSQHFELYDRPISIDYNCDIFQTMAGASHDLGIHIPQYEEPGVVRNEISGAYPAVLHFNGRSEGMEDWYKTLYEEET